METSIEEALHTLLRFIDEDGMEYPDALYKACQQHKCPWQDLQDAYDNLG